MNQLIALVGELVDAIELREAGEPELRPYDAELRVRMLERRLAAEYRLLEGDDENEASLAELAGATRRLVKVT